MVYVFLILIPPVAVLLGLVMPIWAFFDAYRNPNLTRLQRMLWRVICLIFWGPGSALYGVAVSRSTAFRRTAAVTLLGLALLVLMYFYIIHKR